LRIERRCEEVPRPHQVFAGCFQIAFSKRFAGLEMVVLGKRHRRVCECSI